MTRNEDVKMGLKERVELIEEQIPELAVSIHQNSFDDPAKSATHVFS